MSSSSQRSPSSQFPVPNSLPSYWRKQPAAIDNHRSTTGLVPTADIVVIGAGYSGASIVHHLVEESLRAGKATPSIIILEAREACSGATGRNGMCYVYFLVVRNMKTLWQVADGSAHKQVDI